MQIREFSRVRFILKIPMNKLLQLSFIPRSTDFALLVLRLWIGLTLFFNHGLGKITGFSSMSGHFPDPVGIGSTASLILAILAEGLCAVLLVVGVATRFAALILVIHFAVVFFVVHHGVLKMSPGSGELPFLYLAGAVTILLAGGGRFVMCKTTNDVTPS